MDAVNAAMRSVFGAVWAPFDALPPVVGVLVLGVAFGVLALIAMKYTTDPKRVEHCKDRYQGHILAIKLFKDSFTVVTGSLGRALAWIGAYLGEQFKPMLVMLVPFMLLFAQMQMRLAYTPLKLGEKVLLTVELDPAKASGVPDVVATLPPGVELAGLAVREPSRQRVVFPIVATAAGAHELSFTRGGETVTKTLHAGDLEGAPMVSPLRGSSFWDLVLYPSEPSFGADSSFAKIELRYPVREIPLLGLDLAFGSELGMCLSFVLVTIVAAFALKGVFGVTI
jgi:hypothetical protein